MPDVDIEGSVMLPDYGPEDRTVSWISQLPLSIGDRPTTAVDVPAVGGLVETVDELDRTSPCDPTVGIDCSKDLTDSQPIVSTPPVDTLPPDAGSVVVSGAEHTLFSDRTLGVRTRYGRVVRPVVRLIQHMHKEVLAGR